jgi:putative restriction endonuclease
VNPADRWLAKLCDLNPAPGKNGLAPHKPLLLLALVDLVEAGKVPGVQLDRTPELTFRFLGYWRVVAARRSQKPDIRMPFHHLSTQGFWSPRTADGRVSEARNTTAWVLLDEGFRAALDDPDYRNAVRRLVITRYFAPAEQLGLFAAAGMPTPTDVEVQMVEEQAAAAAVVERGRDARFRLIVVAAYNYTCALTGHRLTTVDGATLVDAAHIHQFAKSRNDDPRNGLALSKTAHWLFDHGLWTIGDDFTVEVAEGQFSEHHPQGLGLLSYRNHKLLLPSDKQLWPAAQNLAWHRKHRFLSRQA